MDPERRGFKPRGPYKRQVSASRGCLPRSPRGSQVAMVTVSVGVASSRGSKGLARSRVSDSPILTLILREGNGSGACLLGVGGTPVSAAGENPGATRERSAVRPAPPHDPRNSTLAPGVVYTRSRTLYTRGHPPRLLSAVWTRVCSGALGVGCHPAPRAPRPCPGARRRPPSGVLRFQVGTARPWPLRPALRGRRQG